MKVSFFDLYLFSLGIGFKNIFKGRISKEVVKRIVCPMDPSRYYELPRVANLLALKRKSKILDISSPKLLVYYLAVQNPSIKFVAVDKLEREIRTWRKIMDHLPNLTLLTEDATRLRFPNYSFDEVFSVSVIEHVKLPNKKGDAEMMKEVNRILKPGGKYIFTTIISNRPRTVYSQKDLYHEKPMKGRRFFYRIYDKAGIERRIIKTSPLKLVHQEVCNYRFPIYEKIFNELVPASVLFGFLHVIIVPFMIKVSDSLNVIRNRAEYLGVLAKKF